MFKEYLAFIDELSFDGYDLCNRILVIILIYHQHYTSSISEIEKPVIRWALIVCGKWLNDLNLQILQECNLAGIANVLKPQQIEEFEIVAVEQENQ